MISYRANASLRSSSLISVKNSEAFRFTTHLPSFPPLSERNLPFPQGVPLMPNDFVSSQPASLRAFSFSSLPLHGTAYDHFPDARAKLSRSISLALSNPPTSIPPPQQTHLDTQKNIVLRRCLSEHPECVLRFPFSSREDLHFWKHSASFHFLQSVA